MLCSVAGQGVQGILAFARDAAEVSLLDRERPDLRYVTPQIASTSLPYKEPPADTQVWFRRNGDLLFTIAPGIVVDEDDQARNLGYAFGAVPRMLIAHLSTQAVLTGDPKIFLPHSMAELIRDLGMGSATGGKKGNISRFRNQTERLLHSSITLQQRGHPHLDQGVRLGIANSWRLWWNDNPGQRSFIDLSDIFFKLAISSPAPVSMHALKLFQKNPVQMDLYWWLTYRFSYLDRPTQVTWDQLMEQFGFQLAPGPQGRHQFKKAIIDALAKVLAVYQAARVEVTKHGLLLSPSPPHIPFKGLRALQAG